MDNNNNILQDDIILMTEEEKNNFKELFEKNNQSKNISIEKNTGQKDSSVKRKIKSVSICFLSIILVGSIPLGFFLFPYLLITKFATDSSSSRYVFALLSIIIRGILWLSLWVSIYFNRRLVVGVSYPYYFIEGILVIVSIPFFITNVEKIIKNQKEVLVFSFSYMITGYVLSFFLIKPWNNRNSHDGRNKNDSPNKTKTKNKGSIFQGNDQIIIGIKDNIKK